MLPILRNTFVGILGVDPAVCDSAIAMGMTDGQLLRQVQLPLAARTIMAGIRVATVTTIGTATIAAAIGGGGLGVFIFRGVASVDTAQILAGASTGRCDGAFGGRGTWDGSNENYRRSDPGGRSDRRPGFVDGEQSRIRVGSKNFTEQVVLGEIIAQHLEHRLQQKVDRQSEPGRHAAGASGAAQSRNRSVSRIHRHRAGRDSERSS